MSKTTDGINLIGSLFAAAGSGGSRGDKSKNFQKSRMDGRKERASINQQAFKNRMDVEKHRLSLRNEQASNRKEKRDIEAQAFTQAGATMENPIKLTAPPGVGLATVSRFDPTTGQQLQPNQFSPGQAKAFPGQSIFQPGEKTTLRPKRERAFQEAVQRGVALIDEGRTDPTTGQIKKEDPEKVFRAIASMYPEFSTEAKRILVPKTSVDDLAALIEMMGGGGN